MFTKFVKEELKKCKYAKVSELLNNEDNNITQIKIEKLKEICLEENKYYLIQLSDYVTNPSTNSTLSSNWNNNTYPKYSYWKVEISKIMANMVKINGVAFEYQKGTDINELWSGWVPIDSIFIIEEL